MSTKMTAFDYFMTLVIGVGVDHAVRLTGRKFRLNERLTSAQQSALECALLDDEDTPVLLAAWDGQGALFLDAANVAPLVRELIDLTNSEDDIAEDRSRDPAERSGARGARTALQNLSTRLLAAVALP